MTWIWEHNNWPNFIWNQEKILPICRDIMYYLGSLNAKTGIIEKNENAGAELDSLLKNIIASSEIEGESLNVFSVRSSLAKRLKIKEDKSRATARTESLAELQFDILQNAEKKVSLKRLYKWHRWLFAQSEQVNFPIGKFRGKTPMQVVSGRIDKPKIHFEAPPQKRIKTEIKSLLEWVNKTKTELGVDPFIRAGIIHLWFVTIHPFEDGNGRLARIFSELTLAQYDKNTIKLYSVSSVILNKRNEYYSMLEKTQRNGLDITQWLVWFLNILKQSIIESQERIEKVLYKTRFWKVFKELNLLSEQKKVLNIMLDSETNQFANGISAMQYQKITNVSKATATRHLTELARLGCLKKLSASGRSTRYEIKKIAEKLI